MTPEAIQYDHLPLEQPIRTAVAIYVRRLAVFAIATLAAFAVLGLGFAVVRYPVIVSAVTSLLSLVVLMLLYTDNASRWAYPIRKLKLFGAMTLGFAKGKTRSPVELIHAYRNAIAIENLEELQVLSKACSELNLMPAKELEILGRQILDSRINWSLAPRDALLFPLKSSFSGGEPFKRAWLGALTQLPVHSEVGFFNRSSNGLAFAFEFLLTPAMFTDREEVTSRYFDHASFWVAFYVDQREAMRRLEPQVAQFWGQAERVFYVWDYRNWQDPLSRYDFINLASAHLLTSDTQGTQPIFERLRHQGLFQYWYRQTEFGRASPNELFFVNHLAWAFQHEEKGLVELALREIRKDHRIVQMVSPFIKIVV